MDFYDGMCRSPQEEPRKPKEKENVYQLNK